MSYRLHAAQQIGAAQVALSSHLTTSVHKASSFHQENLVRWQVLLDRMEALCEQPAGEGQPDPVVLAELRRKVAFVKSRAALLQHPRTHRIMPAFGLLGGYFRYERGVLSLLRDLAHGVSNGGPTVP